MGKVRESERQKSQWLSTWEEWVKVTTRLKKSGYDLSKIKIVSKGI